MAGKSKHYFAGGHTARGFYPLYDSNLQGLDRIYILLGGPGTGKSTFIQRTGETWLAKGYDLEWIHASSDNDAFDGVIIPELKVGVVSGIVLRDLKPKAPGLIEKYVHLGSGLDTQKLARHKDAIVKLNQNIEQSYQAAYNAFATALRVHDEWERIYIENMQVDKANALINECVEMLLPKHPPKHPSSKTPTVKHRYLGAATPKGAVDFIPNLTEDIEKRYFLKGRPGSGKSTLLKRIAREAEARGLDVEMYHCGFDPNSIDMVIVKEAGFAIFDSTLPHEHFPERENDEIIDMYERVIRAGTDEQYEQQIRDVSSRYRANMNEAISYLAQAKQMNDELKSYYTDTMDFAYVDQIWHHIRDEMLKFT